MLWFFACVCSRLGCLNGMEGSCCLQVLASPMTVMMVSAPRINPFSYPDMLSASMFGVLQKHQRDLEM